MTDEREPQVIRARPEGVADEIVEGVGKVSEAYEWLIRARGIIYEFHQTIGRVDTLLTEGADALQEAGEPEAAELLRRDMVGRNVLDGRWTFQVIEEFDRVYFQPATEVNERLHRDLLGGRKHLKEAEMKQRLRSTGTPGHEAHPAGRHRSTQDAG